MKVPTTPNMPSQALAKEQSIQPNSGYYVTRKTNKKTSQIGSLAMATPHMLPWTTVLPNRLNNTSDTKSTQLFRTSHMTTSPVLNVKVPTQKLPSVDGSIQRKQYGDIKNSGHLHNIFHGKISKSGLKYNAMPSNLSENKPDFTMTTRGNVMTTLSTRTRTESTTAITDYTPYVRLESNFNTFEQSFLNKNPSTNEVIMQNFRVPSERVTGLPGFLETTSNNQTKTFSGSLPIAFPPGYNIVSSDRKDQTTAGSMAGAFRSFQMDDIVHTPEVNDKIDVGNFLEDTQADNNTPGVGFYSDFQVIDGADNEIQHMLLQLPGSLSARTYNDNPFED